MREIKFRVWDKKEKVIGVVRNTIRLCLSGEIVVYSDEDGGKSGLWEHDITDYYKDQFILMQYTGLLDKNDKEIYEGDLVRLSKFADRPAEVYWDERWAEYRMRVNGEMQYDKTHPMLFAKQDKVIGNIWENPELLER